MPTNAWKGSYTQNDDEHEMEFSELNIDGDSIAAEGTDEAGLFVIAGTIEENQVKFVKEYTEPAGGNDPYSIFYKGELSENKNEITGFWDFAEDGETAPFVINRQPKIQGIATALAVMFRPVSIKGSNGQYLAHIKKGDRFVAEDCERMNTQWVIVPTADGSVKIQSLATGEKLWGKKYYMQTHPNGGFAFQERFSENMVQCGPKGKARVGGHEHSEWDQLIIETIKVPKCDSQRVKVNKKSVELTFEPRYSVGEENKVMKQVSPGEWEVIGEEASSVAFHGSRVFCVNVNDKSIWHFTVEGEWVQIGENCERLEMKYEELDCFSEDGSVWRWNGEPNDWQCIEEAE